MKTVRSGSVLPSDMHVGGKLLSVRAKGSATIFLDPNPCGQGLVAETLLEPSVAPSSAEAAPVAEDRNQEL